MCMHTYVCLLFVNGLIRVTPKAVCMYVHHDRKPVCIALSLLQGRIVRRLRWRWGGTSTECYQSIVLTADSTVVRTAPQSDVNKRLLCLMLHFTCARMFENVHTIKYSNRRRSCTCLPFCTFPFSSNPQKALSS
jgi:hypothetical protein